MLSSLTMPKTLKRAFLVSSGLVCYFKKKRNNYYGSVLWSKWYFGPLKLFRTFGRIICQFVWSDKRMRKKSLFYSRVSLHEAPVKEVLLYCAKSLLRVCYRCFVYDLSPVCCLIKPFFCNH